MGESVVSYYRFKDPILKNIVGDCIIGGETARPRKSKSILGQLKIQTNSIAVQSVAKDFPDYEGTYMYIFQVSKSLQTVCHLSARTPMLHCEVYLTSASGFHLFLWNFEHFDSACDIISISRML